MHISDAIKRTAAWWICSPLLTHDLPASAASAADAYGRYPERCKVSKLGMIVSCFRPGGMQAVHSVPRRTDRPTDLLAAAVPGRVLPIGTRSFEAGLPYLT